jgi:CheY-like chemotaxis protein
MTTVLLVEDDPAARQGLELALSRLGYGVHGAATGEAALDGLAKGLVDVVVLDVMLPGVDGFEVCRRLRRVSNLPVIPVAGLVRNLNTLLGQNGIAGLKTGSDSAAGGCVLLASWRDVRSSRSRVLIVAAVLGQPGTAATILPHTLEAGRHLMLSLGQALQQRSPRRAHHSRRAATAPGQRRPPAPEIHRDHGRGSAGATSSASKPSSFSRYAA